MGQGTAPAHPIDAETTDRDPQLPWRSRDYIYDILDDSLELVREVSIQDFRTALER